MRSFVFAAGGTRFLSWINDIGSALGLPAAATTLAIGMYSACVAAESAARPESLKEIGDILRNPSWERSAQPSAAINRIFVWTFGERHLGLKCIRRSIYATIIIFIALFSLNYEYNVNSHLIIRSIYKHPIVFVVHVLVVGVLSDYLSLAKSRLFIRKAASGGIRFIIMLIFADILASIAISSMLFLLYIVVLFKSPLFNLPPSDPQKFINVLMSGNPNLENMVNSDNFFVSVFVLLLITSTIFLYSALFTSFWIISVFLATSCIKLITPLHRFTGWFFDVSTHPLKAVGIVAGVLIITGSALWSLVHNLI